MVDWIKRKHIYAPSGDDPVMHSYAQIPVPLLLHDEVYRIYFSSRDTSGKAHPYYLDYDFSKDEILHIETKSLLEHGQAGTFDDSGIMPTMALRIDGKVYLYYIGWNVRKSVPYHLSIGLAISEDDGRTFKKYSNAPIMDRGEDEPFFNTAPSIIRDQDQWVMWYVSTTSWQEIDGIMEPQYLIKRAVSKDGIGWDRDKSPAIDYGHDMEALGRPWVVKGKNGYRMWYSKRGLLGYRKVEGDHYTIGYAESADALNWIRKDQAAGIAISQTKNWDSDMMEYCAVIQLKDREIMLYNGNKFGESGFGYAERPLV